MTMQTSVVGQPFAHDSASRHVDGGAHYADDLPVAPNLLHIHLATSPFAHARIKAIDTTEALAAPGVVAVVTAADIPGRNDIAPILKNEPLLPADILAYVGHPFAAVAATSPIEARRAAKLVKLDAEPLEPVLDIETGIAREHYVQQPMLMTRGNVDQAMAKAPLRLSGQVKNGGQDHFYLETHVAVAIPGEAGEMHVISSTQHPTEVQHMVAHMLGMPFSAVTVEVRRLGGAFGGKESQATLIATIAALVARKTGRPAKLRLDRDDDMMITGKRHPFLNSWDVGFTKDGRILAVDMVLAADCGWSADVSPAVMSRALSHADNAYYYPAARFKGLGIRTNLQSNTAFRGFGGPQGMIAAEAMMDAIAHHLGLDPLEVRRRNFYRKGGDVTPYRQKVQHFHLPDMVERLKKDAKLDERRAAIDAFNKTSPVIKKGLATMPLKFGISFNNPPMNQAGALIQVYADGSILINHGGIEMGQGLYVKVAQVVAETFQVPLDQVRVSATRTDKVPNTSATAASSGADLNGMAALKAAATLKGRMVQAAAKHFDCAPDDVKFTQDGIAAGNHRLTFAELASLCYLARVPLLATGYYKTPKIHFDFATMSGRPFYYYVHGVAAAEVAIDTLTGEWKPLRVDLIHDVGRSLNPALDIGQIEGGFLQGMGWLTLEELVWNKDGRLETHAPSTYKIPTARDLPETFNIELLEHADNPEATVYRSKAVGEPPLMLALSVWMALADAISSVGENRPHVNLTMPATPERILNAVNDIKAKRS